MCHIQHLLLLMGRFTIRLITHWWIGDRIWVYSMQDLFRGTECDTDHYLVVAKVWKRLAVYKEAIQKFELERFNLRKLNELEVRKQSQIKISNRFAALENLSDNEDINRACENIKENTKPQLKGV